MRVAVISDIHANLHALEAVLAAIDADGVDELWCLGDLVGYGPRPNECVALVRERTSICLAGNHDLVVLGKIELSAFAGEAAAAAEWTRSELNPASLEFLSQLAPTARASAAELFHGSARDPIWDYVIDDESARWTFKATSERLVLVGHSHIALEISKRKRLEGGRAPAGTEVELDETRRILNPGSVGQPRDGDPRAAWLMIDTASSRATFCRTRYPFELTQAEMRERSLPATLAERLEYGV